MTNRIHTKAEMYRLLTSGQLGNTVPQWLSVEEWLAAEASWKFDWWGVRSQVAGGPCRLYCPTEEVEATAIGFKVPVNLSVMVDAVAEITLWADVWESPSGLIVHGIEYPPVGGLWRKLMPTEGREWAGLSARMLLRRHLNINSMDDLETLLDCWPGHVVELSAVGRCFGTVPHRNAVVWEVRDY